MKELQVMDISRRSNRQRSRDVTKLDIRKIDDDGYYKDIANSTIIRLSDIEIDTLRSFHRNINIARNRLKNKKQVKVRIYNEDRIRSNKRVVRDKKRKKIRKKPNKSIGKEILITITLSSMIATGLFLGNSYLTKKNEENRAVVDSSVVTTQEDVVSFDYNDDLNIDDEIDDYIEEDGITSEMIERYCNIYHVRRDIVQHIIEKLTDNYTSSDYLENCHVNGIVCKGADIKPNSYEELLIYIIRNIKQDPEKFGLTKEDIVIDNGYVSSDDYFDEIAYYSRLFGLDECFIAAIVNSETGFDSRLFNELNNPAGLRLSSGWWEFSTKEEGFIELCLEVIKYYNRINVNRDDVSPNTIARIRDIHAPLSDGNTYWLDNVIQSYNMYNNNYNNYFNNEERMERSKI